MSERFETLVDEVQQFNRLPEEAKQNVVDMLEGMLLQRAEAGKNNDPMTLQFPETFGGLEAIAAAIKILESAGEVKVLRHQLNPSG